MRTIRFGFQHSAIYHRLATELDVLFEAGALTAEARATRSANVVSFEAWRDLRRRHGAQSVLTDAAERGAAIIIAEG
jgi:hypothetical protein